MFNSIRYLSLDAFKKLKPSFSTVVVSILDSQESSRRPLLAGWRSVLSLEFEDTYEEQKCASAYWPDEPTVGEHARYCQGQGERVPALSDALLIADFLLGHGRSAEQLDLVVHCYGGISRSAAVASWASCRFFVPLEREPGFPNARLLRLLSKAAETAKL